MKIILFFTGLILLMGSVSGQWTNPGGKIYYNGGNVGIGTSTPGSTLSIRNTQLADNASSGTVDLAFYTTNSSDGYGTRISTYKETFNTAGLAFYTQYGYNAPVEKMRITPVGNVGIGTTNPNSTLSIRNTQLADNATSGTVDLAFYTTNAPDGYGTRISTYKETFNTAGLAFYTQYGYRAPVEKMRITSIGKVGIGTTNPNSTLSIRNTQLADDATSGTVDLAFYTTSAPDGYGTKISTYKETFNTAGLAFYTQYGYNAPVEKMRITPVGNIGIGTTTPDYKLDVVGTIRAHEVLVNLDKTADFVFHPSYDLPSLEEVDAFVKENHHLPEIASAKEMEENGLNMAEFQIQLLQKVEELTLYMIDMQKQMQAKDVAIEALQSEIEELKR